jgi:hypothetical protein
MSPIPVEIAIHDFPIQSEPSIYGGTRGVRSRISAFRVSGFSTTRKLAPWIRDPWNPEENMARLGPQDLVGNRCQGIRPHHEMPIGGARSEFRYSGFCVAWGMRQYNRQNPDRETPTQEKVDPLTIGVRDLEGPVHGAMGLANSRPWNPESRRKKFRRSMRVNVIISVRI